MSWLARSIANTLRLDADNDGGGDGDSDSDSVDLRDHDNVCNPRYGVVDRASSSSVLLHPSESLDLEEVDLEDRVEDRNFNSDDNDRDSESTYGDGDNQGRGVREDLSEFRETLTRQFWGVASLLAPPPPPPLPRRNVNRVELDRECREEEDARDGHIGEVPRDFSEMEEEEEEDLVGVAVGITGDVLAFAQNIAHHPETWLDFPLSEDEEFDDFSISDAQYKHARAIECLAPRFAALRIELCPAHLSDGYFWMVYFVLLQTRLNKHDADLLSTPQLVKARAMWMQELQMQTQEDSDWLGICTFNPRENYISHEKSGTNSCEGATPRYTSSYEGTTPRYTTYEGTTPKYTTSYEGTTPRYTTYEGTTSRDTTSYEGTTPRYTTSYEGTAPKHVTYALEPMTAQIITDYEIEKHPIESSEVQFIDKSVIEEDPVSKSGRDSVVGPSYKVPVQDFDEDNDDWLADDLELVGYMGNATTMINGEDISFSDLEDDTDCPMPIKSKAVAKDWSASSKAS